MPMENRGSLFGSGQTETDPECQGFLKPPGNDGTPVSVPVQGGSQTLLPPSSQCRSHGLDLRSIEILTVKITVYQLGIKGKTCLIDLRERGGHFRKC